ncbi:MAG: efflux RND transporter periplasmic adaptor subunit [Verrucomicrobiota bacterium]
MKSIHSAFALSVLLVIATSSCRGKKEELVVKPRPVYFFTVEKPLATEDRSFSGILSPAEGASISFEVTGRVIEVVGSTGKRYKKGDVLARINPRDFQAELNAATATKTEAAQAEARNRLLWESGNLSDAEYEASVAALRNAEANLDAAQKKVEDATLRMPYDGVIAQKSIDNQTVVNAGQTVFTLEGEGGMEIEIGIPAADIAQIEVGMPAVLTLGSLPGKTYPAEVLSIATQPSANSTYPVNLTVEVEDDSAVRAGMDGEATLTLQQGDGPTMAIPVECVAAAPPGEQFVWLLEAAENDAYQVKKTPVETGSLKADGRIAVLGDALTVGQKIVSRGVNRLVEGQAVTLVESK